MALAPLDELIADLLYGRDFFLDGVHSRSPSLPNLLTAITHWGRLFGRDLDEIVSSVEPALRQSILMSLIPCRVFDRSYTGTYDAAIEEHLAALGVSVSAERRETLRNLCINLKRVEGLTSTEARRKSQGIADIKANQPLYRRLSARQSDRCLWCGVVLLSGTVCETLDHVVPKHLGDDLPDGSNWALACASCNEGKGNTFAWSATSGAHDFVERNDVSNPRYVSLSHRWVALRRSPQCSLCGVPPTKAELWVFRRVPTGLAIPTNCAVTCQRCGQDHTLQVLRVRWAEKESQRPHFPGA